MAGILISLFPESRDAFNKVRDSFDQNAFLKSSYLLEEDSLNILKYKRSTDHEDINVYVRDDIFVFAAGTATFGREPLEKALEKVWQELKYGKSLDQIVLKMDGSFFLLVYRKTEKKLDMITDAVGLLNIYYYSDGPIHIISTSEIALARALPVQPSLLGISQFLRAAYILDENSFFEEIQIIKPSMHYSVDLKKRELHKKKYYDFPTKIDWSMSFDEAVERLQSALEDIIGLFPKDQTIVDFTGGNDSRAVMSYMYRNGEESHKISALFSGPSESYEYRLIKRQCSDLGIRYFDFNPTEEFGNRFCEYVLQSHELGSGEENGPFHAPILWSNQNKVDGGFRYSLHGSGGELYRDARWDQEFGRRGRPRPADLKRLIRWRVFQYEYDFSVFSDQFLPWIEQVPQVFYRSYKETVSPIDPKKGTNTLQLDTIYLRQNMRRWGGATISSTNQVIQSVCPLLFRKPLEIALSVNPNYKKGCRLNKTIAERIAPDLSRMKMQTGSPYMAWRLTRLYLFFPFYIFLLKKLIRKISQVLFRKTVFSTVTVHDFDLLPRFRNAMESTKCKELIDYDRMITKVLYDQKSFSVFLKRAKEPGFKYYKILGNIMTLERTMRQAKLKKGIALKT
jgi:hypothetical protein